MPKPIQQADYQVCRGPIESAQQLAGRSGQRPIEVQGQHQRHGDQHGVERQRERLDHRPGIADGMPAIDRADPKRGMAQGASPMSTTVRASIQPYRAGSEFVPRLSRIRRTIGTAQATAFPSGCDEEPVP